MFKSIFNRGPSSELLAAQRTIANQALDLEMAEDLLNDAGHQVNRMQGALNQVVSSVDNITTPNGTLRMIRRIASEASVIS